MSPAAATEPQPAAACDLAAAGRLCESARLSPRQCACVLAWCAGHTQASAIARAVGYDRSHVSRDLETARRKLAPVLATLPPSPTVTALQRLANQLPGRQVQAERLPPGAAQSGSEPLPTHLPLPEDVPTLAGLAAAGHPAARAELLRRNAGLIQRIARRYFGLRPDVTPDDLLQQGAVGVLRAAEGYAPTAGAWSTYAAYWIRQGCTQALARAERQAPAALQSLDVAIGDDEGNPTRRIDLLPGDAPDPATVAVAADTARLAQAALARLTPRQRQVIERRHLAAEARTLEDMGRELGITKQGVLLTERAALPRLRGELAVLAAE